MDRIDRFGLTFAGWFWLGYATAIVALTIWGLA